MERQLLLDIRMRLGRVPPIPFGRVAHFAFGFSGAGAPSAVNIAAA
jgi:hypothetical protein